MGDEHHDDSCHGHDHSHDHDHAGHDGHGDHGHDGHDHDDHGHDGHDHAHHGGFGHHHVHAPASYGRAFAFGIALNLFYVIAEAIWGVASHALALLADAGHNLSDVLALGAAWLAEILSRRSPTANFTYGLRRSSILAALGNAVALLLVTGGIIWESVLRLAHPHPVAGMTVMVVAAIGIVVNGVTAMLFASGGKGDLNLRGAFVHMASDALMALAVVISGGIILMTGWLWVDPVVSLLVSVSIVIGTWSLLRDSLDMALDRVPRSVDRMKVEDYLRALPDIVDLHDLHIWPISTTETALTVHLVRDEHAPAMDSRTLHDIARELKARFQIVHPTLQMETRHDATLCVLAAAHSV